MIWRLMASIMMISDSGGISVATQNTDWPDEVSCRETMRDYYTTPPPTTVEGHHITIKVNAACVPVRGEQIPMAGIPPAVANVLPRIFGPNGLPCGSLTC
jgi:hypothetical protein